MRKSNVILYGIIGVLLIPYGFVLYSFEVKNLQFEKTLLQREQNIVDITGSDMDYLNSGGATYGEIVSGMRYFNMSCKDGIIISQSSDSISTVFEEDAR